MEKNETSDPDPAAASVRETGHSTGIAADATGLLERVRIVLCSPRHPGNIGAVARAMKTMGLSRLFLVTPERYLAGTYDAEAHARASGADDVLAAATFCASLPEALAGVSLAAAVTARRREIGPPLVTARAAAGALVAGAASGEVALVFGNETAGLTNDEVMRCGLSVTIPSNPGFSSLNLGAAAQVMSYELRQAVLADPPATDDAGAGAWAPQEDVERFFAHLERTMCATGFLDPQRPRRLLPKLRRLYARSGLLAEEINILRGFLSSVEAARDCRREDC